MVKFSVYLNRYVFVMLRTFYMIVSGKDLLAETSQPVIENIKISGMLPFLCGFIALKRHFFLNLLPQTLWN